MPVFTFKVTGADKIVDQLNRVIRQRVAQAVQKGVLDGALLVEGEAKRRAPVRTGRLRGSITHEPVILGLNTFGYAVGTNVTYARFVEFGTGRRGSTSDTGQTSAQARGELGYAYGPRGGMPAQPFLFPAFESMRDRIQAHVSELIRQALDVPA